MGPGVTRSPGCIKALASNDLVMMWYGNIWIDIGMFLADLKGQRIFPIYFDLLCDLFKGEVSDVENREEATVMAGLYKQ